MTAVTQLAEDKGKELQESLSYWKQKATSAEQVAAEGMQLLKQQLDTVEHESIRKLEEMTALKLELDEWQNAAHDAQGKLQAAKVSESLMLPSYWLLLLKCYALL